MADIYIDFDILDGLDGPLDAAADRIEGLSTSVPAAVDAGTMTCVITAILEAVVRSAGAISTVLSTAAEVSDTASEYYRRADADTAASLDQIRRAMEQ